MITKKWNGICKRIGLGILFTGMLFMASPVTVQAANAGFDAKISTLKKKFPNEKYWNHVGSEEDNSDGYTNEPCTEHRDASVSHVYGTNGCTCNHFAGPGHLLATQCMGFANKLGSEVFGDTSWYVYAMPDSDTLSKVKVGDIIRYTDSSTSGHSAFVIAKKGNKVTVGEANYTGACQISWTRVINLTTVSVLNYERANNYKRVMKDLEEQPETTEEVPAYTGWKKTKDGKNYQYFKEDELLVKQWITINKKTFYVNKKGFRVTGFNKINKKTYYFNSKGVLQKNKWIDVDGNTYYVDGNGMVVKSKWLLYNGYQVYVTGDGSMAKGEFVEIGTDTYYFNAKGKRSKGFKKYNGQYYYSDKLGVIQKKCWITKGKHQYYLQKSGVRAQSKLLKIGKYRYYFDGKGRMLTNTWIIYKGKRYKANKKGHCKLLGKETSTEVPTESTTEQAETTEASTERATEEVE